MRETLPFASAAPWLDSCILFLVDHVRITEALAPYLGELELTPAQLDLISTYIDILLKWNARTNLTAIRNQDAILRRHFGESFFAARHLLAADSTHTVIDVGSGAGFPGLPLKIFAPGIHLTLIESHNKKNTFLREAVRALQMENVEAYLGRAERYEHKAQLVTMRAVEKFQESLPIANALVEEGGSLALLIGTSQLPTAREILPGAWSEPQTIPNSEGMVLATRRSQ